MKLLLYDYEEEDIVVEKIKPVPYFDPTTSKSRRYYPDIYIPKDNLLIEVKSTYWLNHKYEKNKAKFMASASEGFTLHLYVFDVKTLLFIEKYFPNGDIIHCPMK